MKYLYQFDTTEGLSCCPAWQQIEAQNMDHALEQALDLATGVLPLLEGCEIMAYVGENTEKNLHPNGKPICVHGFKLKIEGRCTHDTP